ncbi:hypothetical protein ACSBL2_23490 [Pedobacter sp. AW31-3R]|uniref:hypothetical protein n=1 Tax=Pedobacter sp. AW31-3R TaxID=3445781 RepID=UPI003FA105C0
MKMDKNLIILIFAIVSSLAALGLGFAQYLAAKEDKKDADDSKAEAQSFQRKLEQVTKEQKETLEELAGVYKKNAEQEEEFRKYMTGGNNLPILNLRAIKRTDRPEIGDFVEVQLDIENEGNYPFHNVVVGIEDLFGFELYNKVRITRSPNGSYALDGKPKQVDFEDYKSSTEVALNSIPKKSKPIPIYTRCYPAYEIMKQTGMSLHVSWNSGKIVYYPALQK